MSISLEKASDKDAIEMIEFEKAASSKYFHAFTDIDGMGKYLSESNVYFILSNGKKVGAIGFEKISDSLAQIQGLNLLPEHRGQGIGKGAIRGLVNIVTSEGFQEANLMVHPENSIAIMAYMKCEFVIRSWKENFFGDGEPRLEMWKKL
jgi:ribosomal protein S18 acetylase RimI-like enzyme